jgi:hypothetical protein
MVKMTERIEGQIHEKTRSVMNGKEGDIKLVGVEMEYER